MSSVDSRLKDMNDRLPQFLMTDGYFLVSVTFKWQVEGWLGILKVKGVTGDVRYIGFYGANTINGVVDKILADRKAKWAKLKVDDWYQSMIAGESKN
jgi:hypothetical protein